MTNTLEALAHTDAIDTARLQQLIGENAAICLLDVRTGGEFDGTRVPGSVNIPLDTLDEHATLIAEIEHPIVLLCKSGARADQAHAKLAAAGKARLYLLDGGIEAWHAAGGEIEHGASKVWAMDRQVRLVAGTISLLGILASVALPKAKWLSGAVATGLTFSAVTNTCAMGNALGRLPYNKGGGVDIDAVLDHMRTVG